MQGRCIMEKKYGLKIKEKRAELNLSQNELAQKSMLCRCSIINFESGKRSPKIKDLQKIANALNVSVESLLI